MVLLLSCQPGSKDRSVTEVKQYTIEQFYQNEEIYAGGFSPDEDFILATTNKSGIFNAVALPVVGGEPVSLTNSTGESVFAISYFPDDYRILYSSDSGGNEINHIFMRDEDLQVRDLTPWPGKKSEFFTWARDGLSFYFISNKRDEKFFDLYEMDIANFEPHLVYENNEGLEVAAISKDKKYLALIKFITTSNNEMYLYEIATGETTHLSPHEGDASYNPQFFDLSNQYLYYLTDEGSEFSYLMRYNIVNGAKEKVYETNWDIWYVYDSWDETYRVFGINQDAQTVIRIITLEDGNEVQFPDFEGGSISSATISKSEQLMRFTLSNSKTPSNIYVYDFDTGEHTQLTHTLNPEIDPDDLVAGKVIRYPSYDGLEIPAIYYQPLIASPDHPVSALVWVHGGPGGQSRLSYFALIQYLVNHGYAVLAVNNRGSSGYGKTFFKMDDQKHGDVDLKDCVEAKKFLAGQGVIDMDKVGILGGSYGGYMVMAALTFQPDAFAVGVDMFGVTNWLRTLRSVPPWWESFKQALYTEMGNPDTEDSVRLYNISPLFHAGNVTKPLMVLQGANDPRVLRSESDEIVKAVRANGVPVVYKLFPDEGHGFMKKENEIEGYREVRLFLDKYLKGEAVDESALESGQE
jgi:dipeptidyl aminopeptidase/acylaminoacyl peptidase